MTSQPAKPVLLVDANAQMRAILAQVAIAAGADDVLHAHNAEEARRLLRAVEPSAVITECILADGDGLSLVEWLRKDPESLRPEAPALVLTGLTLPDVVLRARDAGAHAILSKPVTMRTLRAKIERAMNDPRPFVRSTVYVGPCRRVRVLESGVLLRRLADDGDDPRLSDPAHCAGLAVFVGELAALARGLDPSCRDQLRAVRAAARKLADKALAATDAPLADAAGSLAAFIEACGLSGRLDPEVVGVHVATMRVLTNAAYRREARDQDVIDGLREVVARRLPAAA